MSGQRAHTGARALAGCLPAVTGEAMRKRGFGEYRLLNEWEKIVGPALAAHSAPLKLSFARGSKTDGVLQVQVAPMMALEFQHLQPLILDRIAAYFGYRAVGRMALVQSPLAFAQKPQEPMPARRRLAPALEPMLSECEDELLRESLHALAKTLFQPA
jgi:hypothetical protein